MRVHELITLIVGRLEAAKRYSPELVASVIEDCAADQPAAREVLLQSLHKQADGCFLSWLSHGATSRADVLGAMLRIKHAVN